jgi:hypothetical protein
MIESFVDYSTNCLLINKQAANTLSPGMDACNTDKLDSCRHPKGHHPLVLGFSLKSIMSKPSMSSVSSLSVVTMFSFSMATMSMMVAVDMVRLGVFYAQNK